jgi:hypothetical protein
MFTAGSFDFAPDYGSRPPQVISLRFAFFNRVADAFGIPAQDYLTGTDAVRTTITGAGDAISTRVRWVELFSSAA